MLLRSRTWLLLALCAAPLAHADGSATAPTYAPYKSTGIYTLGETVGWKVMLPPGAPSANYRYVVRRNNLAEIKSGTLDLSQPASIEVTLDEPGMVYAEVISPDPDAKPQALGAAVSPWKIAPAIPEPADFDQFWQAKIKALRKIPAAPELTVKPSERKGVDFATIKMKHMDGKHVWGQIARPAADSKAAGRKFPGLIIFQWAGGPYPLQQQWVTSRAAEGWLALNIQAHDVPPDAPKEFYDSLPETLKKYNEIGRSDRDKNYFLQMYLADIRAVDYLMTRPDWDGKTIVVMGTSMGGQQSFCTAGLHPRVTAMLVHVPAGADANGTAHGRRTGYPNWPAKDPEALRTAQYFDTVNCAARIKVPSLVSMGFLDTVTPPVGIWAAFNQIKGPKEAVPLPEAPHNHQATPEQQEAYMQRSAAWLQALVMGQPPIERTDVPRARTDENSRLAHEQLLKKKTIGQIDAYFIGDSITRRWGTSDPQYRDLLANWRENFMGWNAANFGWGADRTQNILWRLRNGELDGVHPRIVVILAGTNNVGRASPLGDTEARAAEVTRGVTAIVREVRKRAPRATVVVTGITPRNDNLDVMPVIRAANAGIERLADGKTVRYITLEKDLADAQGNLLEGMSNDGLHLTVKAYQQWANALKPIFRQVLGPPAAQDRAPAPTGDPSASKAAR